MERTDEIPVPDRRSLDVGDRRMLVREVLAGRARLHGRMEQAAFALLFADGCAPDEAVSRIASLPTVHDPDATVDSIRSVVAALHRTWRHLEEPFDVPRQDGPADLRGRSTDGDR